jgi:hypothetical protein
MPCYDNDLDDPYYGIVEETISKYKAKINKLTRLLCEAMQNIDDDSYVSKELKLWWKEHQRNRR